MFSAAELFAFAPAALPKNNFPIRTIPDRVILLGTGRGADFVLGRYDKMPLKVVSFPRVMKRACTAARLLAKNNIAVSRIAGDLETFVRYAAARSALIADVGIAIEEGRS
jgi:hypothetical protein